MECILQAEEKVKYSCSCGSLKSIARIYFCRHCMKIRCGYCVSHEVDLHYCGNCLENLPSTEARLKKNRCSYCFNCPSCQNILNVRAVSSATPHPDDPAKMVSRKLYYLACGFCRWTSREASIPDQSTASGGWPERECSHAKRVSELLEHYQELALLEKLEEEEKKKKYQSRPSFYHYAEKLGLGSAVTRKRLTAPPREQRQAQTNVQQAKASEQVEPLPDSTLSEILDLTSVSSVGQRFAAPDSQPISVSQLYPVHKSLLSKRSLRCRECEHNVSKPEFNPSSTKFKIQLSAFYHVPDVKFLTCEPIYIGKKSELIISLCNPSQHITSVTLLPLDMGQIFENLISDGTPPAETPRQIQLCMRLRKDQLTVNGSVELPDQEVQLLPRDDAAEFDDTIRTPTFTDDPRVVAWRKGNKVALRLCVTPLSEARDELVVAFLMKYTYINTMTTLEKKDPQKLELTCKVFLNAGTIFMSSE